MKGEKMTRKEAKNELRPIKDMEKDIRSIELEIERLTIVATRMTPSYDADKISTAQRNRLEEAVIKMVEYKERLSSLMLRNLDYKNRCLNKIQMIEPQSLRKLLIYYYYQGRTLEEISELIDKTPRWTYELFCSALDEYAKI